jgi:pentatricopeptide repeat protein
LGGVALITLLAVALVAVMRLRPAHGGSPKIMSLAVLPLKNLSADTSEEYLADGMTEALIGSLSGIHDLRVISRTSAMHFKDTQLTVPEIARTLHVDAVVEGSVIRDGSRIRVHAQLIRAATDEHFWSEEYDREWKDVLGLQSELAQAIAAKVEVTISGQEHSRLVAVRHTSPEVYESYLKGQFGKGNTRAEVEENISYFEEAIRKDPTFAPAYLGLADQYDELATVFMGVPPGEVRPKVLSSARKALDLDPENAEAHALIAGTYSDLWRWSDAEAEYRRALELNPNDPAARLGLADWLLAHGRFDEALAQSQRARELDPLGVTGLGNGWILFHARRYDESVRELRSVVAVHPDLADAHWFLGYALIASGQPQVAISELEKARSLSGGSAAVIGVLIRAYAHAGQRAKALELLDELKRRQERGYVPAGAFVNAYLGLDDKEQAFASLERAYQEQSNILKWLKVHPHFDPLRSDPRFAELLRRVGLAG